MSTQMEPVSKATSSPLVQEAHLPMVFWIKGIVGILPMKKPKSSVVEVSTLQVIVMPSQETHVISITSKRMAGNSLVSSFIICAFSRTNNLPQATTISQHCITRDRVMSQERQEVVMVMRLVLRGSALLTHLQLPLPLLLEFNPDVYNYNTNDIRSCLSLRS